MLQNIRVVLVNTSHPGNIGGAARAMKNMGLSRLVLVEPRLFPHHEADARASGAGDILENAQVVATLEDALVGCNLVLGTSARDRRIPWPLLDPRECGTKVVEEAGQGAEIALVFGREDSGLTNEELELADVLTGVPMVADYPSLNLGQAVMVFCYQLSSLNQVTSAKPEIAEAGQLSALRARVGRLLENVGAEDDQKLSDWLHQRLGLLQQRDAAMLHTLLHDIEKKLTS